MIKLWQLSIAWGVFSAWRKYTKDAIARSCAAAVLSLREAVEGHRTQPFVGTDEQKVCTSTLGWSVHYKVEISLFRTSGPVRFNRARRFTADGCSVCRKGRTVVRIAPLMLSRMQHPSGRCKGRQLHEIGRLM
jgi:hypothetical protein